MTDQSTTGTAPAQGAAAGQPQGDPTPAQGAARTAQGANGTADGVETVDSLRARLAELERDNRTYRAQIKTAQEKAAADQQAGMTENERMAARLADLERQLTEQQRERQETTMRLTAVTAATRMGFRNPDLAYRLLSPAAIEYDESGTPRNVERLLADLGKAEPYLLTGTLPVDYGGGQRGQVPGSAGNDMNRLIRRAAGR